MELRFLSAPQGADRRELVELGLKEIRLTNAIFAEAGNRRMAPSDLPPESIASIAAAVDVSAEIVSKALPHFDADFRKFAVNYISPFDYTSKRAKHGGRPLQLSALKDWGARGRRTIYAERSLALLHEAIALSSRATNDPNLLQWVASGGVEVKAHHTVAGLNPRLELNLRGHRAALEIDARLGFEGGIKVKMRWNNGEVLGFDYQTSDTDDAPRWYDANGAISAAQAEAIAKAHAPFTVEGKPDESVRDLYRRLLSLIPGDAVETLLRADVSTA
jgi:hypothetical protein